MNHINARCPAIRAALKTRVAGVARELVRQGVIPSEARLHRRMPEASATLLRVLRDELRDEGAIPTWDHLLQRGGHGPFGRVGLSDNGLLGETEEERDAIQIAAAEIAIERYRADRRRRRHVTEGSRWDGRSVEDLAARTRVYRNPFLTEEEP